MYIITSERSDQSSFYQSYIGDLDGIQTALKPLKKPKKLFHFIIILRLAESLKTMNRPRLSRPNSNRP